MLQEETWRTTLARGWSSKIDLNIWVTLGLKGVPMLESGSALEDETLTIRLATLENPEVFGRKYPAAHLEEIMANLPFSDSRRNRVKFRQRGLS